MCRICKYNQVKTIDRALLTGVSLTSPGPARQPFARPKNDRQPPTDNRPKNQREISAK